jgi:hypothetical protein
MAAQAMLFKDGGNITAEIGWRFWLQKLTAKEYQHQ